MLIRIHRSGGVAGISKSSQIDLKYLPSPMKSKAREIVENSKSRPAQLKLTKSIPADHYNYKITFEEDDDKIVLECDENNIQDDLKSLVKYIEKHPK